MKTKLISQTLVVAIFFSLLLAGCGPKDADLNSENSSILTPEKGVAYFIYIGLADADTGQQKLTMEEALPLVQQTLSQKKQGATVLPTWGGFIGEDGNYYENETVLVIMSADEAAATALVEEVKTSLHIACVYVERYDNQCGIFGGQLTQGTHDAP